MSDKDHARKVSTNIWRTRSGWRLIACISGKNYPKRVNDPDHRLGLSELKIQLAEWKVEARKPRQSAAPGSNFATELRLDYLPAIAAMADLKTRTRHIELWIAAIAALLGPEAPRSAVEAKHIRRIRDQWLTVGPKRVQRAGAWVDIAAPLSPQTVALRMRALENVWTVLDGKRAPNPVRDVAEPQAPSRAPKGRSYAVVEQILATMPDRRHAFKLTEAQVADIRRALARPGANHSALAAKHGVSETLIRKIKRLGARYRVDAPSLAKLFARAIAYTGFSHSEIHALQPEEGHLHLEDNPPWVWVAGRRKGRGTKGSAQPLTARGAAAIGALHDAGVLGRKIKLSASSVRTAVLRACATANVPPMTPYHFRHSYATEVLRKTKSLDATQMQMRHKDRRTTQHYGEAAIEPVHAAIMLQLEASGAFEPDLPGGKISPKAEAVMGRSRLAGSKRVRVKSSRK